MRKKNLQSPNSGRAYCLVWLLRCTCNCTGTMQNHTSVCCILREQHNQEAGLPDPGNNCCFLDSSRAGVVKCSFPLQSTGLLNSARRGMASLRILFGFPCLDPIEQVLPSETLTLRWCTCYVWYGIWAKLVGQKDITVRLGITPENRCFLYGIMANSSPKLSLRMVLSHGSFLCR